MKFVWYLVFTLLFMVGTICSVRTILDFRWGETPHTVRLTSTGNSVSEYRDFPFSPMETIVGQVEKIGSLTWGMVWRSILAEI